jgi:hypothetical protein
MSTDLANVAWGRLRMLTMRRFADDLLAALYLISGGLGFISCFAPVVHRWSWPNRVIAGIDAVARPFSLAACIHITQLFVAGHGIDAACGSLDISNLISLSGSFALSVSLCVFAQDTDELGLASFAFTSVALGSLLFAGTPVSTLVVAIVAMSLVPPQLLRIFQLKTGPAVRRLVLNTIPLLTMHAASTYIGVYVLRKPEEQFAVFVCRREAGIPEPAAIWGFSVLCALLVRTCVQETFVYDGLA